MQQDIAESPFLLNAWAWFEKNRKQVMWGAIAVAVIGFIVAYLSMAKKEKEKAAGEELSRTLIASAMNRKSPAESADGLLKVASANSGTQSGGQALLLAAGALFGSGKYADAQAAFERFNREYPGDIMTAQAIFGAGASLAAQGKHEEAARAFKDTTDRYPNSEIAAHAKSGLAGVYEMQGKLPQALVLYEEIATKSANTSLGSEAANRADALRAKLPPVPAMSTPETVVPATNAAATAK